MESSLLDNYEIVVGLEIHAQMLTHSKAYSSDPNEYGQLPNTQISAITLAHPGTLPRFNKKVLEYAIKMGVACSSNITPHTIFARKNYFYPDLPKGYQITQDKTPICTGGYVPIKTKSGIEKTIKLTRIHMEEDAGKSLHMEGSEVTLVDYNRAGVPLIEIVSEPDIRSGEEAYAYLIEMRRLVRYLGICDGNMEEGSLRCDANISIRPKGQEKFGTKVEVKNMNSMRNVQRAIDFEAKRQAEMLQRGEIIVSETRNFDANTGTTHAMRLKETLNDYRYFPEPDLAPVYVSEEYLSKVKESMPSLPHQLRDKFMNVFGLPEYDANVLIDDRDVALYFEHLCTLTSQYKAASNWIMGPVKSYLNELTLTIDRLPIKAERIAELIALTDQNLISFASASQNVFPYLISNPECTAEEAARKLDVIQESDEGFILPIIEEILSANPEKVEAYRSGKKGLLGMFMGELMKKTAGKADPKLASKLLNDKLNG